VITVLLVCIGIAFGWNATNEMMQRKFEGSDSSMGVRFDQIDAAVNLWSDSPGSFVFGTGLGSGFPDGRERNYSEFQYIELQSLYLFVQLGLIGMLLYLATLVVNVRHLLDPDGRRIFWLYMLSGCTNPTILDTNQIIATMLLVCLFPRGSSTRS
jgi:O-antigen ligase